MNINLYIKKRNMYVHLGFEVLIFFFVGGIGGISSVVSDRVGLVLLMSWV